MKLRQKIYDSSESINRLIKITNSFHHYNNLKKIKERKPLYSYINENYNNYRLKESPHNKKYNNNYNNIIINNNNFLKKNRNYIIKKEKDNYMNHKVNNIISRNNRKNDKLKNRIILPPIKNFSK